MPEKSLCQFQVARLAVYETGSRMPERMEARCPFRSRNLEPIKNRVKHIFAKHVRVEKGSVLLAEDKVPETLVQR